MSEFFSALGLAGILVGLGGAAFPVPLKKGLQAIVGMPATKIRVLAMVCAAVGLIILWAARG